MPVVCRCCADVQSVCGQGAERVHIKHREGSSTMWRSDGRTGWCLLARQRCSWSSQPWPLGSYCTTASTTRSAQHQAEHV